MYLLFIYLFIYLLINYLFIYGLAPATATCSFVGVQRWFGVSYCLHFQGRNCCTF